MSDIVCVPGGQPVSVDIETTRSEPTADTAAGGRGPSETTAARRQYAITGNLNDRIALHQRFGDEDESFHSWLFRQVQAPGNARVLEVGCGTGTLWLSNRGKVPVGWRLTLTDLSEAMVREAEYMLKPLGLAATFRRHGVQQLPYADGAFDLAFANHMLYHVSDVGAALGELRRVLRGGARLYAATNGERHMAEALDLLDLLARYVPAAKITRPDISAFSMETGVAELEAHFDDVRLFERRDHLVITEAEPLERYVLSLVPHLTGAEAGIDRWRDAVAERFSGGVYRVQRVTGFFEAL